MKFGQGWCDSGGEKQVVLDAGFQQHWPQKPNLPGHTSIFLIYARDLLQARSKSCEFYFTKKTKHVGNTVPFFGGCCPENIAQLEIFYWRKEGHGMGTNKREGSECKSVIRMANTEQGPCCPVIGDPGIYEMWASQRAG